MDERHAWIKSRKKKYLRLLAVVLCFCLLFTSYPDIMETLSVLAEGTRNGDGIVYVSGFENLPEEVREQTVPVGTGLEELSLPDTLEAVVVVPKGEIPSKTAGQKAESSSETAGEETKTPSETAGEETKTPSETVGEETKTPSETAGQETETSPETAGQETESPSKTAGEGAETSSETAGQETESPSETAGKGTQSPSKTAGQETESPKAAGTETESPKAAGTETEGAKLPDTDTQPEEPSAGEKASETAENKDSAQDKNSQDESVAEESVRSETHTVTVEEYHAENVITPERLTADTTQEEAVTITGVTWMSQPEYDSDTEGVYLFTAVLPEGYVLAEGASVPQITVTVRGVNVCAQISGWHFDEENVAPKGDLFYDAGSYSLVVAGGSSEVQIPFADLTSVFPESVTVQYADGDDITKKEKILSVLGWSCPEYAEDEEGSLPYSGSFFFRALLGEDGKEKEYAFAEGVEQIGVWVVFDAPMLLAAVTATPGTITSNQEWGAQDLAAGTYTIREGVTVTVSGRLTVKGAVTINGGGKLVRAGSYAGSDNSNGSNSALFYLVNSGDTLTLENITIDGNSMDAYGPAVYMSSGTVVNLNNGAVIQNNYNMNVSSTAGTYAGGGIHCESGTLNINGGAIKNCKTEGSVDSTLAYTHAGGGVYLKGTCNMTSGSITGNSASNGGGIYLASSGATLYLTGGTISGNHANGEGDGIYYSTQNNSTSKIYIGGNANVKDIIFLDNRNGTLWPFITSKLNYKVTLKCNSMKESNVLAEGSGYTLTGVDASKIFMENSGLYSKLDAANNQIVLSTTEEAEAKWQTTSGGTWQIGRFTTALANVYDGGTIKLLKDVVLTEKAEIAKTVTITSENSASPRTITRLPEGSYGNITLTGSGRLTLTDIIYDGNRDYINGTAAAQSLIKIEDAGTSLTLGSGCIIRDGYKTEGSGVIAVYGTMLINSGAIIENCEATGTGGAVWVAPTGTFTMNGGTIQRCKAGGGGAAISSDGKCILNGGSIKENTDSSKNCTVYLRADKSGDLTLNGVTISGNTYSVYNEGMSVSVAGDSTLSGRIYTTNAIKASGSGVSSLTKNYHIEMSTVSNGTTVVTGSVDTTHFLLDNSGYTLIRQNGAANLIAAKIYKITYNKNSGTIANESNYTSYIYGKGLTLPTPTRTNYAFDGWYENSGFSGSKLTSIGSTATGDKTYYAKWTANKYSVSLHVNGGSGGTNLTSYTYGTGATLPTNWTKTGYQFNGWYDNANCTGTAVTKISGTNSGKKEYWAGWKAKSYTVQFNYQGATGGNTTASKSVTYQSSYNTLPNPTRTGYTFAGWYTTASGGTQVTDSTKVTTAGAHTLFARWTPNPYTVTFNYQGATGSTKTKQVTYDSAYGQLPAPERTGYTFKGWYTASGGAGSKITSGTTVQTAGHHTLYAYWKDETKPAVPVLQSGVTLPTNWTNTQTAIPLSLYDGVGVTELWVSIDGANYTQVSGFTGSTGSMKYSYVVTEGEHTYRFKAMDVAGNESDASEGFKVMLDQAKPVIDELTYENKTNNVLNWTIGKESLIITVPVTEQGSGVSEISYTLTPESGTAETKTSAITNGKAAITVSADFKGTIAISCSDAVGNAADGVTIGASGGGVIVEDNAPEISALADRGPTDTAQTGNVALSESYYESAPAITVTVKDDTDNAVTAGIASIVYHIGEQEYPVTVSSTSLRDKITFPISPAMIPTGVTTIKIEAIDNAGNTASETITLKVKGPEKTPAAEINYQAEWLTGLVPDADYTINGTAHQSDADGCIAIDGSWLGTEITIVRKGNGSETKDSEGQKLDIPLRPAAPAAPELESRTDRSVTLKTITNAQYRIADESWQTSTAFAGLEEKTVYSFNAYYPATDTAFASLPGDSAEIATMPTPPTEDKLAVDYVEETFAPNGGVEVFTEQDCNNKAGAGDVTAYMGKTLYIRYPTDGIIPASLTTAVQIPTRPKKPDAEGSDASYPGAQDGSITGLDAALTYEIRVKGPDGNFGEWKDAELSGTEILNLSAGEYEVCAKAVENQCFRSETAAVTIGEKPTTQQDAPTAVQIDYTKETLTGLVPDAEYSVTYTDRKGTEQTVDVTASDGEVLLKEEWLGKTITIVRKGNGKDKTDSDPQSLPVPARPAKPAPTGTDETGPNKKDGKLTGLTADTVYEVSIDGGKTWQDRTADENGKITGLAPDSYVVRVRAGASSFASEQSELVTIGAYQIIVTFMANGKTYQTVPVDYGKALTEIPPVPAKKDAGNQIYTGEWCSDEQGTPAVFTGLTADMIVYAVYREFYTVTLGNGEGYILSAVFDSTSPVKEGGSFGFKFTLNQDYEKTGSFAVKVNGVKVELTKEAAYTITDIRENKNVTVEGVEKKASPSGSDDNTEGDNTPPTGSKPTTGSNSSTSSKPTTSSKPATGSNSPSSSKPTTGNNSPTGSNSPSSSKPATGSTQPSKMNTEKPSSTEKEQLPEEKDVQTIPASTDNGRITASDETIETDSITETPETTPQLEAGSGMVIVMVVCEEETYTAGVKDTVTAANAVLTPEQIQLVNSGENIEIRMDVRDISKTVPGQDKEVIESGLTECRKDVTDLTLGMYIDISMFIKVGKGDWDAVTSTEEPIDVVFGIPKELKGDGRKFYIIRSHDGEYTLLTDTDDNPETITISTNLFSAYAIAYEQEERRAKCGLCHICPAFLGICCFIWLAVILAILLIIWIVIWRKRCRRRAVNEKREPVQA